MNLHVAVIRPYALLELKAVKYLQRLQHVIHHDTTDATMVWYENNHHS